MIVALDVGERRIGIAVSDPAESYALPLRTLERTTLHDDLSAIVALARDYAAGTIVVGDPVALSGERGLASQKMDAFVATLGRAYDGTIERVDERLTTAQATRALVAADLTRKARKRIVDQLAAALILDAFLARRGRDGR
ncbi:MAG: Holliday junction resolvase RuvX [Candidatus Eremiobacteraeota bacterium]|nr:Holliday junction resolvase RuvX [Candidatus Eremiobacteraeota bacterium]MBC5801709.1 Holliday junction resolvase RuvX [Candidatus Eremiobacteraeota bacterium]MBC5821805.1 Holliday junction resolvase RuvX [Candidatus Eremiobacteraeota bacterium]